MSGVDIFKNRDFTVKTKVLGVESVTIRFPVKHDAEPYWNHPKILVGRRDMAKSVFCISFWGPCLGKNQMRIDQIL